MAPRVGNGLLPPHHAQQSAAATSRGGFKRRHGAFRQGELARQNLCSHYGTIEDDVVSSKLLPRLATIDVLDNGRDEVKTWTPEDDAAIVAPIPGGSEGGWGDGTGRVGQSQIAHGAPFFQADCFAVATAEILGGRLYTTDAPLARALKRRKSLLTQI